MKEKTSGMKSDELYEIKVARLRVHCMARNIVFNRRICLSASDLIALDVGNCVECLRHAGAPLFPSFAGHRAPQFPPAICYTKTDIPERYDSLTRYFQH